MKRLLALFLMSLSAGLFAQSESQQPATTVKPQTEATTEALMGPGAYGFNDPTVKTRWRENLPADCQTVTETCAYSPSEKTVYALGEFCGLPEDCEMEFIAIGPLSDRAYESLIITWDNPSEIAKAFTAMGIADGKPAKTQRGLGMAQGERFSVSLKHIGKVKDEAFRPLSDFISDAFSPEGQEVLVRGFPFVGANVKDDDLMPASVLAVYTEAKSVLGLPYVAPKSIAYGAYRTKTAENPGAPVILAFRWMPMADGSARVHRTSLAVNAETIANPDAFLNSLRTLVEDPRDVFLSVELDPSLTLAQVVPFATLMLELENKGGFVLDAPLGQIPIRAFTPQQSWKVREGRVFQPWEIEVFKGEDGTTLEVTLSQILEDWSVEGNEPALTRKCYPGMTPQTILKVLKEVDQNDGKVYVAFFYTGPGVTVGDLLPYADALADECPTQWIFIEK